MEEIFNCGELWRIVKGFFNCGELWKIVKGYCIILIKR